MENQAKEEAGTPGIAFEGGASSSLQTSQKKIEQVYFHNSIKSPVKAGTDHRIQSTGSHNSEHRLNNVNFSHETPSTANMYNMKGSATMT
jgi:hypothetical protein